MTQTDLLNLAQSVTNAIAGDFSQIITITFAMVIGIYYFLNTARLGIKVFAFIAYSIGMLMYFGMMLAESNIALGIEEQMATIPDALVSRPVAHFLAAHGDWVEMLTNAMINVGFFVLWFGVFWLLFFWKKTGRVSSPDGQLQHRE